MSAPGAPGPVPPRPRRRLVLIGRDSEVAVIDEFLERVGEGFAALVVEGEAGIGKTSIWAQGVDAARDRGFRVLLSHPTPSEAALSFAGLGDLADEVVDEALAGLPEPQRRALQVALLRAPAAGRAPEHRTVSTAFLGTLRALSRPGPLLLAIDDIQWLDRASTRVLTFALRRLGDEPVVILAARRPDDDGTPDPMRDLPPDRVRRLTLGPLTVAALHHVLRSTLGVSFPRPLLLRVHGASGGNPLFALEMARVLQKEGRGQPLDPHMPVPESLAGLVRGRIAGLSQRDRRVLLTVAAMAHPTLAGVELALPASVRPAAALRRIAEAGAIELDGDRIRFSHPLLGSVLYTDASPSERRLVHRRLASVRQDVEERGMHLALAAEGPDAGVASALDEAARRALSRGAPDAAADLWEMARRLTPGARVEERRRRSLDEAAARFEAGNTVRARELLEEVAGQASGPARAEVLRRLGMVRGDEGSWQEASDLFERALTDAGEDHRLCRAIEQDLGYSCLFNGDTEASKVHAQSALAHAEAVGERQARAESLSALGFVEFVLGSGIRLDLMEPAVALERRAGDWPLLVLRPTYAYAQLLKYSDRLDEARELFRSLLDLATDRGHEHAVAALLYHLAELECRAGDWEAAARYANGSVEAGRQAAMPFFEGMALYAKGLVDAHRGEAGPAREAANAGLEVSERTGVGLTSVLNLSVLGFLELSLGNPGSAHGHLERAVALASSMGVGDPGYFHLLPDDLEALVDLGDLDRAGAHLRDFEERAEALDRPWALATAARCRGLLEASRGDMDAALRAFSHALDHHARLAQPFELARTLFAMGRVQRRAKQKRGARESLTNALSMFEELGATLWAARAEGEMARIGGRAPGATELTPTEERVAALAADGMTNREIASTLFMTVRTVEWNLSKVYQKLQLRSRTELTRRLGTH